MRSFVVGTAGHIDHGKSALVRALTGTDPDRLKEEKERGITIDLGFAHCPLSADLVASFVDVPGHERFVRSMLAGVHGIDAVVLVVAADESVMPQTREHFHICRLVGVPRGLVALTKCDVTDPETRAVAELEVRDLVQGSFLDGQPVIHVSSRTGEGLDRLREVLLDLAREAPVPSASGLLRLPIDRVFTLKGFGTVVTGTLVGGTLRVEEEVELLPRGLRARVRGLEVHGEGVPEALAGSRVAVNLAGVLVSEIARGDVIARAGSLEATSLVDAEVTLLPSSRGLEDGDRVRVHVGSAEVLARVRVLGGDLIGPGGAGLAQLRLEGPAVPVQGDRLVLRSYSPLETIGGARVLDPHPPRRRRRDGAIVRLMADAPDQATIGALMVREAGRRGIRVSALASRLGLGASDMATLTKGMHATVQVGDAAVLIDGEAVEQLGSEAEAGLARFHSKEPLRSGMPREELKGQCFARVPDSVFERVVSDLVARGIVRTTSTTVALASHEVHLSEEEGRVRQAFLAAAAAAGLAGIEAEAAERAMASAGRGVVERVVRVLLADGSVVRIGDGILVSRQALQLLSESVRERFPPGSRMDVAAFKDLTGLTRKHVIPLLEYLDRERVTRRFGDSRLVLA